MAQLEEEVTLNAIRKRVGQSYLEFNSFNEPNLPAGRQYVDVLSQATEELDALDIEIQKSGRLPVTLSAASRDDPYATLFLNIARFKAELRKERDVLRRLLEDKEQSDGPATQL